jgi:hypothetical protein
MDGDDWLSYIVLYEVCPRSSPDSDGNGVIEDPRGAIKRLDHIASRCRREHVDRAHAVSARLAPQATGPDSDRDTRQGTIVEFRLGLSSPAPGLAGLGHRPHLSRYSGMPLAGSRR